jgi:hypothetical protein
VTDRRIAPWTEQTLVTVVPPDSVTLVGQLAQHLENFANSLRIAHVMAGDHDDVAGLGRV